MRRLTCVVIGVGLLFGVVVIPQASATDNCVISGNVDKSPWLLSQRVGTNTDGNITNTRGLQVTLSVASPYLHPNDSLVTEHFVIPAVPSWVRQGLRIASTSTTYVEWGWEYWWQLYALPNGSHWQRRAYYINNVNGNDYKAHYVGDIGTGPHRFYLYNSASGSYPNKWLLQNRNLNTGAFATNAILDPPFDKGNAFTLVTSTDSCNEMTMQTGTSQGYSGTTNAWYKVSAQNNAAWTYGQDGDRSNAATHWVVGGWIGNWEEWFTMCYRPCTKV